MALLVVIDPHASPAKRVSERMLFVEEVIQRVERIGLLVVRSGFLDRQIGGEQAVGKALRNRCDFVTLVAEM